MSEQEGKQRFKIWLKQAEYDLQAAKISLEKGFNEWASYQSEQTVEKALKSVIVNAGQSAPKVHKLSVLFGYCNSLNPGFRNTKFSFRHVEAFTFISRYPFLLPGKNKAPHDLISTHDASASIQEAEEIVTKITSMLDGGKIEPVEEIPGPVSKEQLEARVTEIRDILVREFKPEKIILFGSYSREPLPAELTTMDVLVIAETKVPFIERIKRVRELTRGDQPSLEPLVYTPEEFHTMTEEEGESFFEQILQEGKVIYEKGQAK